MTSKPRLKSRTKEIMQIGASILAMKTTPSRATFQPIVVCFGHLRIAGGLDVWNWQPPAWLSHDPLTSRVHSGPLQPVLFHLFLVPIS